jgi:hypothetical protein
LTVIFSIYTIQSTALMFPPSGPYGTSQPGGWGFQQSAAQTTLDQTAPDHEDGGAARRPPNAFLLYSQAMRSAVRQDNPSLSNTEVSRLLGTMWKEVPTEIKTGYKRRAMEMQEEFKRQHPDYTYRKAKRKHALNELLTKSPMGQGGMLFPNDTMGMYQMFQGGMYQQMGQQFNPQNQAAMMYQQMPQFGQMGMQQYGQSDMQQGTGQMQGMQQGQGMPQSMVYMQGMYPKQE